MYAVKCKDLISFCELLPENKDDYFEFNPPSDLYSNTYIADFETRQVYNPYETAAVDIRKDSYSNIPIVPWNNSIITITEAEDLYRHYLSENARDLASDIYNRIKGCKNLFRGKYPD